MLPNIYKSKAYKFYIIIPVILVLIALYLIPNIRYGVEFRGGSLVVLTVNNSVNTSYVSSLLEKNGYPDAEVRFFKTTFGGRVEIEVPHSELLAKADDTNRRFNDKLTEVEELELEAVSDSSKTKLLEDKKAELVSIGSELFSITGADMPKDIQKYPTSKISKIVSKEYNKIYEDYVSKLRDVISKHINYKSISIRTVTPTLSTRFLSKVFEVAVWAVVLSTILVFLFFRTLIPALAVLLGAFSDITIASGGMVILGIPLTMASFATLLMLVGFSLDTDMLLTMRVIKRGGDPRERAYESMRTGLTMSTSAIIAFLVLFGLGLFTRIATYYQISVVALMGLLGDIIATWLLNAVIVLWYKLEHS